MKPDFTARFRPLALLAALLATPSSMPFAQTIPEMPGLFAALDGRWAWYAGEATNAGGTSTRPTDGPGGALRVGYRFDMAWDIAAHLRGQWLREGTATAPTLSLTSRTNHQTLDLQAG